MAILKYCQVDEMAKFTAFMDNVLQMKAAMVPHLDDIVVASVV